MKKVKLLLIAIIGLFAVSTMRVDAAVENGSGKEPTSGIGYEIDYFSVNVYDTNALKNTQNKEGLETIKAYTLDNIKVNPSPKITKMEDGYNLVSVKLNIEGGIEGAKKKVEEELKKHKEELTTEAESNKYFVTLTVRYKLTIPSSIKSVYDADYDNIFNGGQALIKDETEHVSNPGLAQMIFSGVYDKSSDEGTFSWEKGTIYEYDNHKFVSQYDEMPFLDEYLLFTSENPKLGQETYRFMMHDIENIENSEYWKPFKENTQDNTPVTPSNNNSNNRNEKITGVPDTAARNASITLFGSSILALGSGIVLWELRKKFNQ